MILAATAEAIQARGHVVVIATTNLSHLAGIAYARTWHEITG